MKKLTFIAAAILAAATATAAQADTGYYAGVDYTFQELSVANRGAADFGSLGLSGGFKFNEYFAAEARLSGGANDEDLGGGVTFGLDSYVGAQGVLSLPLANGFSLYGTLGYGNAEIQATQGNVRISSSDDSVSYGVGAQYNFGQFSLRAGYDSLYDKDDVQIDGFKITGIYSF